jgi:hypothetical protein
MGLLISQRNIRQCRIQWARPCVYFNNSGKSNESASRQKFRSQHRLLHSFFPSPNQLKILSFVTMNSSFALRSFWLYITSDTPFSLRTTIWLVFLNVVSTPQMQSWHCCHYDLTRINIWPLQALKGSKVLCETHRATMILPMHFSPVASKLPGTPIHFQNIIRSPLAL